MPVGPVQLRQVFFACCGRGMVSEALALMQRKDPATGTVRLLGKDVLARAVYSRETYFARLTAQLRHTIPVSFLVVHGF